LRILAAAADPAVAWRGPYQALFLTIQAETARLAIFSQRCFEPFRSCRD